ncbi:hypothetical protein psyc5s11_42010 [Clostridium gelidum]|uniref:Uncharacterized protein n=1 Tax=Clostridium gelidum TaxID=704125 RepID=A0ABM7TI47_9CLOT|nr:hypothetical protein [Clostridium gelidum]BCZ48134.1 hypothetical protein psyc5s11_42010 [Clostridium gelidum]
MCSKREYMSDRNTVLIIKEEILKLLIDIQNELLEFYIRQQLYKTQFSELLDLQSTGMFMESAKYLHAYNHF